MPSFLFLKGSKGCRWVVSYLTHDPLKGKHIKRFKSQCRTTIIFLCKFSSGIRSSVVLSITGGFRERLEGLAKPVPRRVRQNWFRGYAVQYFQTLPGRGWGIIWLPCKVKKRRVCSRCKKTIDTMVGLAASGLRPELRMYFANVEFATPSCEGR